MFFNFVLNNRTVFKKGYQTIHVFLTYLSVAAEDSFEIQKSKEFYLQNCSSWFKQDVWTIKPESFCLRLANFSLFFLMFLHLGCNLFLWALIGISTILYKTSTSTSKTLVSYTICVVKSRVGTKLNHGLWQTISKIHLRVNLLVGFTDCNPTTSIFEEIIKIIRGLILLLDFVFTKVIIKVLCGK